MNRIQLTEVDRRIIGELSREGRLSNKELAERVGLPRSSCHGRVRALERAGVIRGYRADLDPMATGASVQVLILVSVNENARARVHPIAQRLRELPNVQRVYLIGGNHDFVVHASCDSVPALREFIRIHLGSDPDLGRTQSQIIFEELLGTAPLGVTSTRR